MASSRRDKRSAATAVAARTGASKAATSGGLIWILAALLVVIAVWSYSNSFQGVFIGDDFPGIVQNTSIRSLSPITAPLSPPKETTVAGRPVANLTFAMNYAFGSGTNSTWGYHLVNLLIHLLAGLLLFGVVRRSLLTPPLRDRFGDAAAPLAFAIAAIWIAHPLHTQAVTFIVQRVESLMGLFYLATLYCAIRGADGDFQSPGWTTAAIVFCALGMGTKETMVTAPIIVLLWIWLLRPDIRLFGPPRALLIGLAATMVIVIALALTEARSVSAGFGVKGWTPWSYFRTQIGVIVHYVRLAFWPRPLVFQYGWLPAASWSEVLPQFALLASIAVATLFAIVKRWPAGLLGAWFLLILAPSSSILPISTEVAAEHRMYLPLAAIVAAVVLTTAGVSFRLGFRPSTDQKPTGSGSRKLTPAVLNVGFALLALPLAVATHARNRAYESQEAMALDVVQNRPQNAQAQLTYGSFLVGEGRFAEAEAHLRTALTLPLSPSTTEATARSLTHLYLGLALLSQEKADEARKSLQQAIIFRPDLERAYGPLAEAQLDLGHAPEAIVTLEIAIARQPDDPTLLKRAAWVLATSSNAAARNGARAIELAERAVVRTERRDPVALDTLAAALAEAGQFDAAIVAVRRSIDLVPPSERNGLGAMLRGHLGLFEARRPVRSATW
jgi:Tfp pilus assembly protein PilF